MKSPLHIAFWAGNGIGGAEKAASVFASSLKLRGHSISYFSPPGPRNLTLAQAGISRIDPPESGSVLSDHLLHEKVDAVFQYVPGYPSYNLVYEALRNLGDQRPRLVEGNVFGRLDDPANSAVTDFRCFVSSASAAQAYRRKGRRLDSAALRTSTVVYNPLPRPEGDLDDTKQRNAVREELGVAANDLLILRMGRPSHKWNWDEVRAFEKAHRANPLLRLLLIEPREEIWREVEAGRWGNGIILHRALSDFDRLATIYMAGDLMLHMSDWGESYGYTIAEAMQYGLPMVTRTTPWGDNAQVELVEHGVTGYVCNSVGGAVAGLLRLAESAELRRRFGAAALSRIYRFGDLTHETDLLEETLLHVTRGEPLRLVAERNEELLGFDPTFPGLEKQVVESEWPGLSFAQLKGSSYSSYRVLRNKIGSLKARLKTRKV